MNIYKAKNNKLNMTTTTLRMPKNQPRKLNVRTSSPPPQQQKKIVPQSNPSPSITPSPSPQPIILKNSTSERLINNTDDNKPKIIYPQVPIIVRQYPLMSQFQQQQQPFQNTRPISVKDDEEKNENETQIRTPTPQTTKKKPVGVIVMDRTDPKNTNQSKTNEGKLYDYSSEEEEVARTRKVYLNVI